MHPLIYQDDVLRQVFGQLADELDEEIVKPRIAGLRGTMRNAALTCHSFHEPALDALWRTLDSLYPLFNLIPSLRTVKGRLIIDRTLADNDLQRYRLHSCRVRKLRYESSWRNPNRILPISYTRLFRSLGAPLVPSLQVLDWKAHDFGLQLPTLITPTLVDVDIGLQEPGPWDNDDSEDEHLSFENSMARTEALETFLYNLVCAVPNLQSLALRDSMLIGASLESVYGFMHLKSLTIYCYESSDSPPLTTICYQDLVMFSKMTDLTYLDINVSSIDVPEGTDNLTFPSLRDLKLLAPPSKAACLLTLLHSSPLRTISVGLIPGDETDHYQSLFHGLAIPDLVELSLDIQFEPDDIETDIVLEAHSLLPPLLQCRKLQKVNIVLVEDEMPPIRIDDDDLLLMAQAWPCLTDLCLLYNIDSSKMPTIRGLGVFATHCPHLLALDIKVDPNIPFPDPDELPISEHTLQNLDLDGPKPKDLVEVAQWIYTLFPSLESGPSASKTWSEVTSIVEAFHAMELVYERRSAWQTSGS
ncbi:hypothetical protein NEOLEDRAFT_1151672 [Neolentinus lepideus HHB14362 ss-1]|uniref:F-box domain-containing protein n=1 Tax=Neolentinus lepideus HHB14362 ss-1 TaxID=1314782 RepID=A0A165NQ62_9AGAM|nr:hypothetical protein NEOLEDRAFT_1151672 [Neolentinus lepideus HHB14362 ss-1]